MAKPETVVTPLFKASCGLLWVSLLLQAVGFATPSWIVEEYGDGRKLQTGLWKDCRDVKDIGNNCSSDISRGWYLAVQTFEALGLSCLAIATVISVVLLAAVSKNYRLARVTVYVCVFAGLFIVAGNGTFTWKTRFEFIGYSCWLSWAASVVVMVTIVLFECDRNKRSSIRRKNNIHVEMVALEHDQNGYRYPRYEYQSRRHSFPTSTRPFLDRSGAPPQSTRPFPHRSVLGGPLYNAVYNPLRHIPHRTGHTEHHVADGHRSSNAQNPSRSVSQQYYFVAW